MSEKLPISRFQRDLTDSTVLRNLGVAFGHTRAGATTRSRAAWPSSASTAAAIDADLDDAWEVLAEPVQTVMRRHGIADSYEQLKALTRGKAITQRRRCGRSSVASPIPAADRDRLLALTPRSYIGDAAKLRHGAASGSMSGSAPPPNPRRSTS